MNVLTSSQCRAARGLLNWGQPDLAENSGVHVQTISAFENESSTPTKTTLLKIIRAFENNGVEFLPDSGVRKKSETIRIYRGKDGNDDFFDDIYHVAKLNQGDFCVSNVSEIIFDNWSADKGVEHKNRMADHYKSHPEFKMRVLVKEGDDYFPAAEYAEYRWVKKEHFKGVPFYVYGDRLAIVMSKTEEFYACVVHNRDVADTYRAQFNIAWDMATKPPKK